MRRTCNEVPGPIVYTVIVETRVHRVPEKCAGTWLPTAYKVLR